MIIFLYGDDTYRSKKKILEIKEKFIKDVDQKGLNILELDGETMTLDIFHSAISPSSLFAKRRLIIVNDFLKNKSKNLKNELLDVLPKYQEDGTIIIFYEKTSKCEGEFYSYLKKQKFCQEFKTLNQSEIKKWIHEMLTKSGYSLLPKAENLLLSYVGKDLAALENEINKLQSYCQGNIITDRDVKTLVKGKYDDVIFHLTDELSTKKTENVYRLLSDQINSGANEMYLITMLGKHLRLLIVIQELSQHPRPLNTFTLASQLGEHPFVVKKAFSQAKSFRHEELIRLYTAIAKAEELLKTGEGDARTWIEMSLSYLEKK
jgi:DNA polymerase-3 subunit delta